MRSLAVAESCSDWRRRRVGNPAQCDSGNIRICWLVGGGVLGLGSILQDHGIITMIISTEVST